MVQPPHAARTIAAPLRRAIARGSRGGARALALLLTLLAGVGWLDLLRGIGWFQAGPRVADALPLLQLAGLDGQPVARVVLAWLPAGVIAGLALVGLPRIWRGALAGVLGSLLLLTMSQASFALARNLSFSHVLMSRRPGAGPWVEALLFAVGCALPGGVRSRKARR